ncbi:MAG: NUDIX domain-containing protein [Candidatus Shapirobacteria bacterium]|nr:NUDIX domain-containing protein [Candidatus Shapirobacteria bacterium]
MKQDFAYGGVVFKKIDNSIKVLLVKKLQFISWDLPKGHKEGNESDKIAALREIYEETGYKNIKLKKGKIIVSYGVEKNNKLINKSVIFFIGEHFGDEKSNPNPDNDSDEENMEAKWVDINESINLVTFKPFQDALKQAIEKFSLIYICTEF